MPTKHRSVLSDDVAVKRNTTESFGQNQRTQRIEIARALAPLRSTISNPPTAADVKAVSDKLDSLLAGSGH